MNGLTNLPMFLLGVPEQGATSSDPMAMLFSFAPIIIVILIFYFLMIRPQSKKQKELERMIAGMKKGDSVVTIGGLHGIVDNVGDNYVIIKADENTKLKFAKSAIATVTPVGGKANE